jgi:hypothetical protein
MRPGHPHPKSRGLAVTFGALLLTGCGLPSHHPIQLFGPDALNDSTVSAGPVEVGVRVGFEWVELHVENHGEVPVEVDWSGARLLERGGEPHRLVDLGLWYTHFQPANPHAPHEQRGVQHVHSHGWSTRAAPHSGRLPDWLKTVSDADRSTISPGDSQRKVMYPAEHLLPSPYGWRVVASLLCRGEPAEYRIFTIHLPVSWTEGRQQTIVITGRALGSDAP